MCLVVRRNIRQEDRPCYTGCACLLEAHGGISYFERPRLLIPEVRASSCPGRERVNVSLPIRASKVPATTWTYAREATGIPCNIGGGSATPKIEPYCV
jgi:hypothetical protein